MAIPTCPENCDSPLPVVSFSDCAPEVNLSEIEYLIIGKAGASDFDDETSASEWAARLDNDSTDADKLRLLRVIGDKPAPTDQDQVISGQRTITVDRSHTINADIDETNDVNYDAMRALQCGGGVKLWYVTRSGHVFGGKTGISASMKVSEALNRGENEIQRFNIVATWKSKFSPERSTWPLYGLETYGGAPIGG